MGAGCNINLPIRAGSVTVDSNSYGDLRGMFEDFIRNGKNIVTYNGETTINSANYSDGTGYGSNNYMGFTSFSVDELRLTYIP